MTKGSIEKGIQAEEAYRFLNSYTPTLGFASEVKQWLPGILKHQLEETRIPLNEQKKRSCGYVDVENSLHWKQL